MSMLGAQIRADTSDDDGEETVALTPRMREVLEYLDTDEGAGDLITEGREAWFGQNRTSRSLVRRLIELCAIGISSGGGNGLINEHGATYWHINEIGHWFLVDEARALAFLREGFTSGHVDIPTAPARTKR